MKLCAWEDLGRTNITDAELYTLILIWRLKGNIH